MSAEDPDRCVGCSALADLIFQLGDGVPVCSECKEDGTFERWLDQEIETALVAGGYRIESKDGRKLIIPPGT